MARWDPAHVSHRVIMSIHAKFYMSGPRDGHVHFFFVAFLASYGHKKR